MRVQEKLAEGMEVPEKTRDVSEITRLARHILKLYTERHCSLLSCCELAHLPARRQRSLLCDRPAHHTVIPLSLAAGLPWLEKTSLYGNNLELKSLQGSLQ